MKNLIIIGAGGFGREVFGWAQQCPEHEKEWTIKGFLDDNPESLASFNIECEVIASVKDYQPASEDLFVCAIGRPKVKKTCCRQIMQKGGRFTNIIHPKVTFGRNVELGSGVILCPGVTMTCGIKIGSFVTFNLHCAVGHDVVVGDWCQMSSFCDLTGGVVLGEGVFMGSHASILPGVRVGDNAVVGAGSTVLKNVNPDTTVIGVPAKVLKY